MQDVRESGFMSKAAAEEALKRAREKRAADQDRQVEDARADSAMTFARYFQLWVGEHVARRCAENR